MEFPDPTDLRTGSFIRGDRLVELDITDNFIEQVSAWIQLYSSISRLYASENKIYLLSKLIGDNVFVRELDMSRCMLYKIPEELGKCTLMVRLYLENNQLNSIPIELSHMTVLEELRLSHNVLSSLPEEVFEKTLALRVLTVENNLLTEVPRSVYALPTLTFLDVSYNSIGILTEELGQCLSLCTLLCGDNQIPTIPDSIANLEELKIFEIHNNRLSVLPTSMARLKKLRRLAITGNALGPAVPAVLSQLPALPHYNISGNKVFSQLLQGDPLLSFSSDCTDMRVISAYLNATWGVFRAPPDEASSKLVGEVCSACHSLVAAYYDPLLVPSASSDELPAVILEYIPIMRNLVANMKSDQENLTLENFVGLQSTERSPALTLNSMNTDEFHLPQNYDLSDFLHGIQSFNRFSDAARAMYGLCMQYSEAYDRWKLALQVPEHTRAEQKASMTERTKTLSKVKFKAVSFRRDSKQSLCAKESVRGLETGQANEGDVETGDTIGHIEDGGEIAPDVAPLTVTEPVLRPTHTAPQTSQLPLLSEAVLRNILEQRQKPLHDGNKEISKTVYPGDEDPVVYMLSLMDCYSGIGSSLMRIADFLCVLLRSIEDRGGIKSSCLSVCQRLNDDFDDLMGEKSGSFAKKMFKAPGSEKKSMKTQDILSQLESMSLPGKNSDEGLEMDEPVTVVEGEDVPEVKQNSVDKYSPLNIDAARATVWCLEKNRRRVLILAAVFLERASFILKCCGWDAKSMKMQNSAQSSRRAVHHFQAMSEISSAVHVGHYYGMALQKLRICSTAVREYYAVLSISPLMVWHPLQLDIVKCYLDMGEYYKADELLYKIIEESPSWRLRADKAKELGFLDTMNSNLSREVRMLAALLSSALVSISSTGMGAKEQLNRFEVESSGIIRRRHLVSTETEVGWSKRLVKRIAEAKAKDKAAFVAEKLEYERSEILLKVADAKLRALAIIKQHEDFVELMGPIVLPS